MRGREREREGEREGGRGRGREGEKAVNSPAVCNWGMFFAESHSARLFLGVLGENMTGNGNSSLYFVMQ